MQTVDDTTNETDDPVLTPSPGAAFAVEGRPVAFTLTISPASGKDATVAYTASAERTMQRRHWLLADGRLAGSGSIPVGGRIVR